MADVTFDGTARLIIVNTGITELSSKDIYSWWKQWVLTPESDGDHNAEWLPAFSTTGGDPVSPGVDISAYYFLINNWRLRPQESEHSLLINGNLYVEGGVGSVVVPTLGDYNVLVTSQVSPQSQAVDTGVGTVEEVSDAVWGARVDEFSPQSVGGAVQVLLYGDEIYVDATSAHSGIAFGTGTKSRPVNNIADAVAIADSRNIKTLILMNSISITATDDVSNKVIRTIGTMGITVTIESGATVDSARFQNVNLQGEITNGDILLIYDCTIYNLENFSGVMNNVALGQGAEISIGVWATIIQATAGGDTANEPEIDLGTADINISHYTGNLKVKGKTGGPRTVLNMTSGNLLIANTCIAGDIQVLGTGVIEKDESGPSCNVDIEGFISIDNIWGTPSADHVDTDSVGEALDRIDKNATLIPGTL